MSASQMDFEQLRGEVDVLSQQLIEVKGRIESVLNTSSRETVEPFKTKMENFDAQGQCCVGQTDIRILGANFIR